MIVSTNAYITATLGYVGSNDAHDDSMQMCVRLQLPSLRLEARP